MKIRTRYVTVEVNDGGVRERIAFAGDRLRTDVTAYMRSAADDVGTVGDRLRARFLRAANRVNTALAAGSDRIAPPEEKTRLKKVDSHRVDSHRDDEAEQTLAGNG